MSLPPDTKSNNVDLEALRSVSSSISSKNPQNPSTGKKSSAHNIFPKITFKLDSKVIYDAILGLSDGLTVPFALTAGLASIGTTHIVILGGLAELVAGAISMGLGGFIGAKSEHETYQSNERKCTHLISTSPHQTLAILQDHFSQYHLPSPHKQALITNLLTSPLDLQSFLLTHHFDTTKPEPSRPYISALTLGLSYFLGGFLALIPYFCVRNDEVILALWWSIGVMSVVMLVFGYGKTCVVRGWRGRDNVVAGLKGAVQMLVVGAVAVGVAVGLVRGIEAGSGTGGGGV